MTGDAERVASGDAFDQIAFDDNRLLAELAGEHDAHFLMLERELGVKISPRGNLITIEGDEGARARASAAINSLYRRLERGQIVAPGEVKAAAKLTEKRLERSAVDGEGGFIIKTPRRTIAPRSPAQRTYLEALREADLVFGVGPAGTGKTYLAVANAVDLLLAGEVERIILTRPALEAGERIGFLPGDMKEKVDPYLRPLYDALGDMLHGDYVERRIVSGEIEIAPLGFMRGRTLARAAVILDEAQNATVAQIKMFMTRLGEGAHMAITGDPSQSDLNPSETSGLADALSLLSETKGVRVAYFTAADVVRHPLVARIIKAYDARDAARRQLDRR